MFGFALSIDSARLSKDSDECLEAFSFFDLPFCLLFLYERNLGDVAELKSEVF